MKVVHDDSDLKKWDARMKIESAKAKDISAGIAKLNMAQELERKAYAIDLQKTIDGLAKGRDKKDKEGPISKLLGTWGDELKQFDSDYKSAIEHNLSVPVSAMGQLPLKYAASTKLLKLIKKVPSQISQYKTIEFTRIQNTRESLLHFLNA
jgi:hypothetical protein